MDLFFDELFNFMKSAYLASLGALTMVQDHSERMLNMALQQSSLWQDETKKMVTEWAANLRNQRHDYQQHVEDNLRRLEDSFYKIPPAPSTK